MTNVSVRCAVAVVAPSSRPRRSRVKSAGIPRFPRADARRTDRMSGLRCIGSPLWVFVTGEAHMVIIDKSFIKEHPLAFAWRSRQHGSA